MTGLKSNKTRPLVSSDIIVVVNYSPVRSSSGQLDK